MLGLMFSVAQYLLWHFLTNRVTCSLATTIGDISVFAKWYVKYAGSHWYLACGTTAKLLRHLQNRNWLNRRNQFNECNKRGIGGLSKFDSVKQGLFFGRFHSNLGLELRNTCRDQRWHNRIPHPNQWWRYSRKTSHTFLIRMTWRLRQHQILIYQEARYNWCWGLLNKCFNWLMIWQTETDLYGNDILKCRETRQKLEIYCFTFQQICSIK